MRFLSFKLVMQNLPVVRQKSSSKLTYNLLVSPFNVPFLLSIKVISVIVNSCILVHSKILLNCNILLVYRAWLQHLFSPFFLADSRVGAVIDIHQPDVIVIVPTVPELSKEK